MSRLDTDRIARLIGPGKFDVAERVLDPPGLGQVRVRILGRA